MACHAVCAGLLLAGGQAPFFLVPSVKYEYMHPEGTGHSSSPFFSIWFVYLGEHTTKVAHWLEKQLEQRKKKVSR